MNDHAATLSLQEVGEGNSAPPEWLGEIEPTFLSYEAVPLLNFPFFNEVQDYHLNALCQDCHDMPLYSTHYVCLCRHWFICCALEAVILQRPSHLKELSHSSNVTIIVS